MKNVLEVYDQYVQHAQVIRDTRALLSAASSQDTLKVDSAEQEIDQLVMSELQDLQRSSKSITDRLEHVFLDFAATLSGNSSHSASSAQDIIGCQVEIKPGAGGSEASLFATELTRMYSRLAAHMQWAVTTTSSGAAGTALSQAILRVIGEDAHEKLRWESGVQRVQRVPITESLGRIQTSTVGIIILPILSPQKQAALFDVKDVRVDTLRSSGAGGQHVNKVESAIRLTHLPTGLTVNMQDSRSQHQNRALAWELLTSKLAQRQQNIRDEELRREKSQQQTSLSRSDKSRTWNFSQDRLTDHRLNCNANDLSAILEGGEAAERALLDTFGSGLKEVEDAQVFDDALNKLSTQTLAAG